VALRSVGLRNVNQLQCGCRAGQFSDLDSSHKAAQPNRPPPASERGGSRRAAVYKGL
jgi:hypothetical protein